MERRRRRSIRETTEIFTFGMPGCDPCGVGIFHPPTGDVAPLNPRLLRCDPFGIRRKFGYDIG
jgi:hypothetical protein